MTLSELLATVTWTDVRPALLRLYPEAEGSIDVLRLAFESLQRLDPVPSTMRILVDQLFPERPEAAAAYEVFGCNGRLNREQRDFPGPDDSLDAGYANAEAEFSLSLEPWERWLGMVADPATLARYTVPEIIAHCLWAMTLYGMDASAIEAIRLELRLRDVALGSSATEDERRSRRIPWERMRGELKRRLDSSKRLVSTESSLYVADS